MQRLVCALVVLVSLAAPAAADVTLRQVTSGMGPGMTATGTTYIKGLRMRTDTVLGGTTRTVVFDLVGQRQISYDSTRQDAEVFDLSGLPPADVVTDRTRTRASITPTGQTRVIDGRRADAYTLSATIAGQPGPMPDLRVTVSIAGTAWVVRDAPGAAEWAAFYRAVAERGWAFGDPRALRGNPAQARSMAELYRQMAETGGIAYETTLSVSMQAEGPMAREYPPPPPGQSTTRVDAVSTATLDDALFDVPPGYRVTVHRP